MLAWGGVRDQSALKKGKYMSSPKFGLLVYRFK